jgi:hypothetical protein
LRSERHPDDGIQDDLYFQFQPLINISRGGIDEKDGYACVAVLTLFAALMPIQGSTKEMRNSLHFNETLCHFEKADEQRSCSRERVQDRQGHDRHWCNSHDEDIEERSSL